MNLNKKIIRTIGDPYFKIKQDSLRILRAIRFASCLNFKIEDNLKNAIKENKDLLKDLSYERKKEELTKIFTSDNKAYGIKLLKELDLLEVLELTNIDNVLRTKDLIGMWSTITINDNYPFTKKEKDLINNINKLLKEDLIDFISLDVKAPFEDYRHVVGEDIGLEVKNSMDLINDYNVKLETRTTVVPTLHTEEDIKKIASSVKSDIYTIQQFRNKNVLDPKLEEVENPNAVELIDLAKTLKDNFDGTIKVKTGEFGSKTID